MSTDLRGVHWREIRNFVNPMRKLVHEKLALIGPATAKEIAEYTTLHICSIRPRLTELFQLGLAEQTGERRNSEHEFRFISIQQAESNRRQENESRFVGAQMNLLTAT